MAASPHKWCAPHLRWNGNCEIIHLPACVLAHQPWQMRPCRRHLGDRTPAQAAAVPDSVNNDLLFCRVPVLKTWRCT